MANAIPRPAWWFNFLTTEPLAFASLDSWSGTVADLLDTMFDPTVTYDDLAWIRDQWPGKVVVKGCRPSTTPVGWPTRASTPSFSNHGGRQLDRAPVPFHLLPEVVQAVGPPPRRRGAPGHRHHVRQDVVAAVAHGAHFTLVGWATSTA